MPRRPPVPPPLAHRTILYGDRQRSCACSVFRTSNTALFNARCCQHPMRGRSISDRSHAATDSEIAATTSPRFMHHLRSLRRLRFRPTYGKDVSTAGRFRILRTANTRAANPYLYETGASPAGELQRPPQRHRCNDISRQHLRRQRQLRSRRPIGQDVSTAWLITAPQLQHPYTVPELRCCRCSDSP